MESLKSHFNYESGGGYTSGSFALPDNALFAKYCTWLGSQSAEERRSNSGERGPFLSIVTRTQGKRIEELSEVLLCLSGQECMDFEILLVGHNVGDEQKAKIDKLVEGFTKDITSRIRYISVNGGTRTTPLNEAFSQASGHYIAILDDDDIVFDNWVSNFYELAKTDYGKILFSYPIKQDWEAYDGYDERHQLRATGELDPCYCHGFNYIEQLTSNECPPCSLAFPSYAFQDFGIVFDESLTTTEDWDFLMRTSFLCDIVACDQPSSIYRIWKNAESSHSVHGEAEWQSNHARIVERFNTIPIIFPGGMVERLSKGSQKAKYSSEFIKRHCYLSVVASRSSDDTAVKLDPESSTKPNYHVMFHLPKQNDLQSLELHLLDMGCFTLDWFDAWLENGAGDKYWLPINKCKHSGYQVDSRHIIFIGDDSTITIKLPKNVVFETLHVHLAANHKVEGSHGRQMAKGPVALWLGRIYRWLLRKLRIHQPI